MFNKKKNIPENVKSGEVVLYHPPQRQGHPPPMPQPLYTRDPHTGQLVLVHQDDAGSQPAPQQRYPGQPPATHATHGDEDFTGFEGRLGNPQGATNIVTFIEDFLDGTPPTTGYLITKTWRWKAGGRGQRHGRPKRRPCGLKRGVDRWIALLRAVAGVQTPNPGYCGDTVVLKRA